MPSKKFSGFPDSTFQFLNKLQRNNNREWFQKNKSIYESAWLSPSLEFIEAMVEPLHDLSPHFRVEAKKMGGSLMRIYRDTRFAKDKSPYKTNIGIHFRHMKGKDIHAPGFYFHIDRKEIFVGAGLWHPDSKTLTKIRQAIDQNQTRWKKILSAKSFQNRFDQYGDSLKRPPRGFTEEHPLIVDLKRKDHIGLCQLDRDFVQKRTVVGQTIKRFEAAMPYMQFLCEALDLRI